MEIRTVEEDARVLDEFGDDLAVLLHAGSAVLALGFELPLIVGEPFGRSLDTLLVFLISEVRAVAATTLYQFGRGFGEHALATVAEDTRPIAFEERHVEHPGTLAFLVVETNPFVKVKGD